VGTNNKSFLKGRETALLTKHKKEIVIKPTLEKRTGCKVQVFSSFDTDVFGTFTGEIERAGTQIETARLKAEKAIELSGFDIGLSSEGSFGPHPSIPFVPFNMEIVMLVDRREELRIWGEYSGYNTNYRHDKVVSSDEAFKFAQMVGFPEHFLVIKPGKAEYNESIKGICDYDKLDEAVQWAIARSPEKSALIETDMRAHANPTRMSNILKATENLIQKIDSVCIKCGMPGFWVIEKKQGLPCEICGSSTSEILSEIWLCQKCGQREEMLFPKGKLASAARCNYCNP